MAEVAPIQNHPESQDGVKDGAGELNGTTNGHTGAEELALQVEGVILGNTGEQGQQEETQQDQPSLADFELHRACAEGNVEEVKQVLSRGLESLETLGEHSSHFIRLDVPL
jgi:hypothetical protein